MGDVTPIAPPRLVTAKEVAEYLSIPEYLVKRMARDRRLPGVKVGGGKLWRFRMEDIYAWVKTQTTKPQPGTSYKPREKKETKAS